MRNIFLLYMPPTNTEAMVHYEDTIRRKVEPDRINRHVDANLARRLEGIFGGRRIAVWGSRDGPMNRQRFDRMREGDEVLILVGSTIKLLGRVAGKTVSPALSHELWQNLHGGNAAGWDLIYFIANPQEIDLPFREFCRLLGYQEDYLPQGFTSVVSDKLEAFYARYDDLYSILVALKSGHAPVPVLDPQAIGQDPEPTTPPAEPDEPADASEHTRMQWTLLRLGRQAGEKVWAPRNDQKRLTSMYEFKEFESTFAAGLDTQVKYVENIDVVWKAEFRIDAAFEIENSTSIYSGLLRFADLTMVAPNSVYPLMIVAPAERRSRVKEQLLRPVFKHLKMGERVRFLSYERVREIEGFFGSEARGLSAEVMSGKAEKLVT